MEKIIECIPNFSEGKDLKKISAIAKAIISVPQTRILHKTSDRDHNRTVITFIGPPETVFKSAFLAVKKAAEIIDITKHQGVHPRIGATDVLPFVALKGITEKELVKMAKNLGQKIGTELNIPIHLYEKAARSTKRQNLANIRSIEFKKKPDFGPSKAGTAGSTALGVRNILIAFNVNLATKDLSIAKTIAKKIRESSGGIPYIKALGLNLKSRGISQVSMNLTNYKVTGIKKAYEAIEKEAKKLNTQILESEIIGMIPEEGLPKNAKKNLKITNFKNTQILKL